MAINCTCAAVKNVRHFISKYQNPLIIILLVFTVFPLCYWLYIASGPHFIAFNSQEWKDVAPFSDDYTRSKMVGDLMNNYKLAGMPENKLLELLGGSTLSPTVSKKYFRDWDLVYWIGVSAGTTIHSCARNTWLVFKIDNHVVLVYKVISMYCKYTKGLVDAAK